MVLEGLEPKHPQLDRTAQVIPLVFGCGDFLSVSNVDPNQLPRQGIVCLPAHIKYQKDIFVGRAKGNSMQPRIADGSFAFFGRVPVPTLEEQIVLVENRTNEEDLAYTLKKLRGRFVTPPDGAREYEEISLLPLNDKQHSPIVLSSNRLYEITGWFLGTAPSLTPLIETYRYEPLAHTF